VSTESIRRRSNDLAVLVPRVMREIRRNTSTVPAATARTLSLLDEVGPSTVSALAQADRCSQPTMTGIVSGLVERGWLQREPHPDDARASLVSMTPEGRDTLAVVRRRNAALVAERIEASGLTDEELATAVAVLSAVLRHD
jgi:DNA-binding MarR family transcriptional regulator